VAALRDRRFSRDAVAELDLAQVALLRSRKKETKSSSKARPGARSWNFSVLAVPINARGFFEKKFFNAAAVDAAHSNFQPRRFQLRADFRNAAELGENVATNSV